MKRSGKRRLEIHGNIAPLGESFRHFAAPGAEFHHRKAARLAHLAIELADALGHQDAEDGLDLLGGEEIAGLAEGIGSAAIVTRLGRIERGVHEAMESNGTFAADVVGQQIAGGHGRTSRLCGVRMNISTR